MVKPRDFGFNEQTAQDNEFMVNKQSFSQQQITNKAIQEYNQSVSLLRSCNINIIDFDKQNYQQLSKYQLTDAVFPNNWISTSQEKEIFIYPMASTIRAAETKQLPFILDLLKEQGYQYDKIIDFTDSSIYKNTQLDPAKQYLEGTGSMIFDKKYNIVYASISKRTDANLFDFYCKQTGYEGVKFSSISSNGKPYYHTNIVLAIGENFAVFCTDSVQDKKERQTVINSLNKCEKEVITITLEQAEKYFCGNLLQARSLSNPNDKYIIMSRRAKNGFTQDQQRIMQRLGGQIVDLPLEFIEDIGGGSARCMLGEIFLPKK